MIKITKLEIEQIILEEIQGALKESYPKIAMMTGKEAVDKVSTTLDAAFTVTKGVKLKDKTIQWIIEISKFIAAEVAEAYGAKQPAYVGTSMYHATKRSLSGQVKQKFLNKWKSVLKQPMLRRLAGQHAKKIFLASIRYVVPIAVIIDQVVDIIEIWNYYAKKYDFGAGVGGTSKGATDRVGPGYYKKKGYAASNWHQWSEEEQCNWCNQNQGPRPSSVSPQFNEDKYFIQGPGDPDPQGEVPYTGIVPEPPEDVWAAGVGQVGAHKLGQKIKNPKWEKLRPARKAMKSSWVSTPPEHITPHAGPDYKKWAKKHKGKEILFQLMNDDGAPYLDDEGNKYWTYNKWHSLGPFCNQLPCKEKEEEYPITITPEEIQQAVRAGADMGSGVNEMLNIERIIIEEVELFFLKTEIFKRSVMTLSEEQELLVGDKVEDNPDNDLKECAKALSEVEQTRFENKLNKLYNTRAYWMAEGARELNLTPCQKRQWTGEELQRMSNMVAENLEDAGIDPEWK